MPNPQHTASLMMMSLNKYLFFSESFFESFSEEFLNVGGSITAPATTGPAKQPLPASSHPASITPFV